MTAIENYNYGTAPTSASISPDLDCRYAALPEIASITSASIASEERQTFLWTFASPAVVPPDSLVSALLRATSDMCPAVTFPTQHSFAILSTPYPRAESQSVDARQARPAEAPAEIASDDFAGALQFIRKQSGLTWDELALLIGVSRRAIHNWLNGSRITTRNIASIANLAEFTRNADQGSPDRTRAFLFAPRRTGRSPYEEYLSRRRQPHDPVELYFNPSQRVSAGETDKSPRTGNLLDIEDFE